MEEIDFKDPQNLKNIKSWQELEKILETMPLENLPIDEHSKKIIRKYGIEKLRKAGIEVIYLVSNKKICNLKEVLKIGRTVEIEDIKNLLYFETPISKIIEFVNKYGIDNIIKLDEETEGIFTHSCGKNGEKQYIEVFIFEEKRNPEESSNVQLNYEEFCNKMYELLSNARDKDGALNTKDYGDYDFIQGDFRKKYSEIFISGSATKEIKSRFYEGKISAQMVRANPQLIELLKGKDLSKVFKKEIIVKNYNGENEDKNINMAQYFCQKIGQDEFLKICLEYGNCLDNINLKIDNEMNIKELREKIDQTIYVAIKESGISYFENLPETFKGKHPELFLPEEIDIELRKKFYEGKMSFEDIKENPQLKDILSNKDISVGFHMSRYLTTYEKGCIKTIQRPVWNNFSEEKVMNLAQEYGKYLEAINQQNITINWNSKEEIEEYIERTIFNRNWKYSEDMPDFLKRKHPEMFLDENAPEELKRYFYDNNLRERGYFLRGDEIQFDFQLIREHPEWKKYLEGKNLRRAFKEEYSKIFEIFDIDTLMKIATKNNINIEKIVQRDKEEVLEEWYKATGERFVPHHIVILNFPEEEIDDFLRNSKKWSRLMKIENYNLNDDGKSAILKAAYSMGVFKGNDEGFSKLIKLFTDIPQELSQEEYNDVIELFKDDNSINEEVRKDFEKSYTLNTEGKYVLRLDKQKDKKTVRTLRGILERAEISRILTPDKAHKIFDSFEMRYNEDFVDFFNENIEEILSNPEYIKSIATIQRQFGDIVKMNAGRRLTLEVANDYIKKITYKSVDIGNEGLAEQAKIAGYSQEDFEAIQKLFNEGKTREFSSIPRVQGTVEGYTYEMLKLDDPLALTIGTLTDCCQEIHGAGQTSMEHSVISQDGRVFCVRDSEGRIVAQSWVWRNKDTICFDNIEIPGKIFELYGKKRKSTGKQEFINEILDVYKKAAEKLMQDDKKIYIELLNNGSITKEQYDLLVLKKVTVGLGYNDIKEAIKNDDSLHKEKEDYKKSVKITERFPWVYTDAMEQYILESKNTVSENLGDNKSLYIYEDNMPIYNSTNITNTVLMTMKRMEKTAGRNKLTYINEIENPNDEFSSKRIINGIANAYELKSDNTEVIVTPIIALIYSKEQNRIKIGDILIAPIKDELSKQQKQKANEYILYQIKKALRQINVPDSEFDLSLLNKEQVNIIESVIKDIEQEKGKDFLDGEK